MTKWWVSSKSLTVYVETKDSIIINTAPIVKKFVGQPFHHLTKWMQKTQQDVIIRELSSLEETLLGESE